MSNTQQPQGASTPKKWFQVPFADNVMSYAHLLWPGKAHAVRWASEDAKRKDLPQEEQQQPKFLEPLDVKRFVTLSSGKRLEIMDNRLQGLILGVKDLGGMNKADPSRQSMERAFFDLLYMEQAPVRHIGHSQQASDQGLHVFAGKLKEWRPSGSGPPREEDVFQQLLSRSADSDFKANDKTSGLAHALGTILLLSVLRIPDTSNEQIEFNETSSSLDLSPLYGNTPTETTSIRINTPGSEGMIQPDCFAEDRVEYLTPSVSLLLILFNRHHNYVARRLGFIKNYNWGDSRNDGIFNCARSINCVLFKDIILHDFMRGILGLPFEEKFPYLDFLIEHSKARDNRIINRSCVEFAQLYHFTTLSSSADETWLSKDFGDQIKIADIVPQHETRSGHRTDFSCPQSSESGNLTRDEKGRFKDEELAQILVQAVQAPAGLSGSKKIHPIWKEVITEQIKRSRKWNVCTLNEFRTHIGLKPYASFREWNDDNDIAKEAEKLYGNINNLELYTGLLAENTLSGGFQLGYTQSYGLCMDIVTAICNDSRFTTDFNKETLTEWGHEYCASFRKSSDYGSAIPTLILRSLPRSFPYNHILAHFPLTPLTRSIEIKGNYDTTLKNDSAQSPLITVTTWESIRHFMNSPNCVTPYGPDLKALTDGYGHMLGFNGTGLHDADQQLVMYSLMPDSRTFRVYSKFFGGTAPKLIRSCSKVDKRASGSTATVDLIHDVINPLCTQWVLETLCGESPTSLTPHELVEYLRDFSLLYSLIFRKFEAADGWAVRQAAIEKSRLINSAIKERLTGILEPQREARDRKGWFQEMLDDIYQLRLFRGFLRRHASRLFLEFTYGKEMNRLSYNFMERLAKTDLTTVGQLPNDRADLDEIGELLDSVSGKVSEAKAEEFLAEAFKKFRLSRLCANVVGLCVTMSVNYASACSLVVDFYLQAGREDDMKSIIDLVHLKKPKGLAAWVDQLKTAPCQPFGAFPPTDESPPTNSELRNLPEIPSKLQNFLLMGYVREAQRLGCPFSLEREVKETDEEYNAIKANKGDRICADFGSMHLDDTLFPEPSKVNPIRDIYLYHGTGPCTRRPCKIEKDGCCSIPEHKAEPPTQDSTEPVASICEGDMSQLCFLHADRKCRNDEEKCISHPGTECIEPVKEGGCIFHVPRGCTVASNVQSQCEQHKNGRSCQRHGFRPWSIQGLGIHKCPGLSFCDNTMPELLKAIFSLPDIKRKEDSPGILRFSPYEDQCAGKQASDPNIFIDEKGKTYPYPVTMKVQFTPEESHSQSSEAWTIPRSPYPKQIDVAILIVTVLSLIWASYFRLSGVVSVAPLLRIFSMLQTRTTQPVAFTEGSTAHLKHLMCKPVSVFRRWDVNTISLEDNNKPSSVEYTLERATPHQLSLVDIDEKDMQLAVYVDGILLGKTTEFAVDKTAWCSSDSSEGLNGCFSQGFSHGKFVIAAGRHTVRIVWAGEEYISGTQSLDWGHQRFRRFMWQIENCAGEA